MSDFEETLGGEGLAEAGPSLTSHPDGQLVSAPTFTSRADRRGRASGKDRKDAMKRAERAANQRRRTLAALEAEDRRARI